MDGVSIAEILNGTGVGGLLILLIVGLAREWIVTGPAHRREVESLNRTISMLEARGDKDAESIATFADTQREVNAEKASETRILAAVRDGLLKASEQT